MGLIHIMERGGDDVRRFEESLKIAKSSIKEACEIFEDMKSEFGERSGYDERSGYMRRDDRDEMEERRMMRRYR